MWYNKLDIVLARAAGCEPGTASAAIGAWAAVSPAGWGDAPTDAAAEKILVSLQYYAAEEDVTVSVSNNAFDENPTWELATIGLKHIFSNSTKTAATWGIGVKVQINKSAGYETISSRPVSGSYI